MCTLFSLKLRYLILLNIYQLNIFNDLFLHPVKKGKALNVFSLNSWSLCIITKPIFLKIILLYIAAFKLTKSRYSITIRASKLWNIILNLEKRLIENAAIFKVTVRAKLVLPENPVVYFWCTYKTLNSLTRIFWIRN